MWSVLWAQTMPLLLFQEVGMHESNSGTGTTASWLSLESRMSLCLFTIWVASSLVLWPLIKSATSMFGISIRTSNSKTGTHMMLLNLLWDLRPQLYLASVMVKVLLSVQSRGDVEFKTTIFPRQTLVKMETVIFASNATDMSTNQLRVRVRFLQ